MILRENVTLEKSGADLAAALFLLSRAGRECNLRAMVRGDFFISLDNRVYRKLAGSPSGQQVSDRRKAIIGTNVLCVNLRRDNAA